MFVAGISLSVQPMSLLDQTERDLQEFEARMDAMFFRPRTVQTIMIGTVPAKQSEESRVKALEHKLGLIKSRISDHENSIKELRDLEKNVQTEVKDMRKKMLARLEKQKAQAQEKLARKSSAIVSKKAPKTGKLKTINLNARFNQDEIKIKVSGLKKENLKNIREDRDSLASKDYATFKLTADVETKDVGSVSFMRSGSFSSVEVIDGKKQIVKQTYEVSYQDGKLNVTVKAPKDIEYSWDIQDEMLILSPRVKQEKQPEQKNKQKHEQKPERKDDGLGETVKRLFFK